MLTHKTILRLYRTAILLVLSTLCIATASAQTGNGEGLWDVPRVGGETITEPSPEATAMRRYQDFPVSYATGTADISIPLLELPGGQVGVSLGLRYHTGGIRRNDISTGVGLGWSLTGLGQVSRQINGFPDEWKGNVGSQNVHFEIVSSTNNNLDYFIDLLNGKIDSEYDLYNYSFPGYAGNFILRRSNQKLEIVQLPATDLTIERVADATDSDATDAFIITTPDGTEYTFDVKEHIEYRYSASHMTLPLKDMDYDAVSTWHVSKIVAPERSDSISISYTPQREWRRSHYANLRSVQVKYSTDPEQSRLLPSSKDTNTSPFTQFNDQRLPLIITSCMGSVSFDIERGVSSELYGPTDCIGAFQLKDANDHVIKSVQFVRNDLFGDGRQKLDAVVIKQDNIITDKYSFSYYSHAPTRGYDLFGYSNGYPDTQTCRSILNYDLELAEERKPNDTRINSNSLESITDISGVKTTLTYEPSKVTIEGNNSSVINGETIIGLRLKSIQASDSNGRRYRKRTFEYSEGVCDIDLSRLTIDAFLSQSGTMTFEPGRGLMNFCDAAYLSTTFTASSKANGYPIENAVIYYPSVTEIITGTNIDYPIKTVYEYDLASCIKPYGRSIVIQNLIQPMYDREFVLNRFLGASQPVNLFIETGSILGKTLSTHRNPGFFEHVFGGSPLLTCKSTYEYTDGGYQLRSREQQFYSCTDSLKINNGLFCESLVYRTRPWDDFGVSDLNVESFSDINFYWTTVEAYRSVCDSTVTTIFYPDGNSRRVKTSLLYDAVFTPNSTPIRPDRSAITGGPIGLGFYHAPGFHCDTIGAPLGYRSFYPLGKVVSSGGESVASYSAMSEYAGVKLKNAGCTLKRLPVAEKWVLQTADGCDSLLRRYEYGRFNCGGRTLTRPTRVFVQSDGPEESRALISSQQYTGYDSRGRITAMTDSEGRRISAEWDDEYDMLMSMSLPDVGLTTSYTIRPLVGYTSITSPSGRVRRFAYSAGRLAAERNTANELIASYTYQLAGDGTSADGRNRFTATVHDSTGDATETTYYDGFGLPVQTVSTVAGGNLVRSAIEYDALDRPVRQYRPVPASDSGYSTSYGSDAVSHYGDSRPYSSVSYRNMGGDKPLQVIAEGSLMQSHPTQYQYTCNNGTDPMYKCRCYRLTGSATSETVKLDGFYKAGALDVTKATDPDGCTLLTFTDWRGIKVLERRVLTDNTFADTYYLYDVLGNVRVIIQPEGAAQLTTDTEVKSKISDILYNYAFIYRYDRRGNCIYSKTPGVDHVTMCYDKLNRLTFRASEELNEEGAFEFFTYDPIGRPAVSGLRWESLPSLPDTVSATVTYTAVGGGIGGTGYSGSSYINSKLANGLIGTANYYDSYANLPTAVFDSLRLRLPDLDTSAAAGNLAAVRTGVYDGSNGSMGLTGSLYSLYSYDTEGRVLAVAETSAVPGWETLLTTKYSRLGHKKWETYTVFTPDSVYRTESSITHDAAGNPLDRFDKFRRGTAQEGINGDLVKGIRSEYRYDALGQLEKFSPGNKDVKYDYNLRGQLTSISSGDLFSQTLKYETGATPCYNGNISEMSVCYSGGSPITRKYTYDCMNRLTAMTSSDGFNTAYTYNLNSSPLTIQRYGLTSDGTVGLIDDLALKYSGNQLIRVDDAADPVILENSLDFDRSSRNYTYDYDGRLYSDGNIFSTKYTPLGNPLALKGNYSNVLATYRYTATGIKLSATTAMTTAYNRNVPTRYYLRTMEFHKATTDIAPRFERVTVPWGYIDASGAVHYYIQDYQGNVRVVADATGNVEQATDYYPYGMPMATSTGAEVNRYKYSGKELETRNGLNFYDFAARLQFPVINIFDQPDPFAVKYPWLNPYLYCAANPINYTDKTGMIWGNEKDPEKLNKQLDSRLQKLNQTQEELQKKAANPNLSPKKSKELAKKLKQVAAEIAQVEQAKADVKTLGDDPDNIYYLSYVEEGGEHKVIKNDDGSISIQGSRLGLHVHEMAHVRQYLTNKKDFKFNDYGVLTYFTQRPDKISEHEVEAYKIQYAVDPGSMPCGVGDIDNVNEKYVGNIRSADGSQPDAYRLVYKYYEYLKRIKKLE